MSKDEIAQIQKRIDAAKPNQAQSEEVKSGNIAFNIAVELVAGAIIGIIIGLYIDNLFDSKPIFLIICIILSFIAAFKTIWHKYVRKNNA